MSVFLFCVLFSLSLPLTDFYITFKHLVQLYLLDQAAFQKSSISPFLKPIVVLWLSEINLFQTNNFVTVQLI